jgi:hypothetical protein
VQKNKKQQLAANSVSSHEDKESLEIHDIQQINKHLSQQPTQLA